MRSVEADCEEERSTAFDGCGGNVAQRLDGVTGDLLVDKWVLICCRLRHSCPAHVILIHVIVCCVEVWLCPADGIIVVGGSAWVKDLTHALCQIALLFEELWYCREVAAGTTPVSL